MRNTGLDFLGGLLGATIPGFYLPTELLWAELVFATVDPSASHPACRLSLRQTAGLQLLAKSCPVLLHPPL